MEAGERMYGSNGKENFLFPLEIMWLTQGYWSATYSHNLTYAMDFQGAKWDSNDDVVRMLKCPCYAPFSCHCVARFGSSAPAIVWQSDDVVNFIDGTTGYATIQFTHEDNSLSVHHIGDTKTQGDIISHTGTMGSSGDHIHIEAKKGTYTGFTHTSAGTYRLKGSNPLDDLLGVNDTLIHKGYYVNHNGTRINYNWRKFTDEPVPPVPPVPTRKQDYSFPWPVVTRKLRDRNFFTFYPFFGILYSRKELYYG